MQIMRLCIISILEEDLDGYMPELIKDGYLYLQLMIVLALEKTLRDILTLNS